MTNDMRDQKTDEPEFEPVTPVKTTMAKAAWQAALYYIRKKNRAAQANGGTRVPL